jgi:hypothetical protein
LQSSLRRHPSDRPSSSQNALGSPNWPRRPDGRDPVILTRLVAAFRASPAFLDLAQRTRSDYQRCLDYLAPIGDTALAKLNRSLVVRIRDKAAARHGRRFGNYAQALLSIVFAWRAERGCLASNPAEKVKNVRRRRDAPEANRPWAHQEREAVLAAIPATCGRQSP